MCDTGNLIDLTGWGDEPVKDETVVEDAHCESVIIESNNFKGPYDPFDSIEKEACIKGLNFNNNVEETKSTTDTQFNYVDQDLNNETPPVGMQFEAAAALDIKGNESHQQSLQKKLVKIKATRLATVNTPPPHNQSSKFSKTAGSYVFENKILSENLQMISAESPVKFSEDEPSTVPIYAIAPSAISTLSDEACSNTEFEARLKMLRIAILDSPAKVEKIEKIPMEEKNPTKPCLDNVGIASIQQTPKCEEVGKLLQDLKALVYQHVDVSKITQFDKILESLSATIRSILTPEDGTQIQNTINDLPHTYIREGTFDLDLELQKRKSESVECMLESNRKVQEIPDVMTCSSATFDGETLAPPPPVIEMDNTNISLQKPNSYVTEVVSDNLALQINEILERHNLTKLQNIENEQQHCDSYLNDTKIGGGQQTVILVVNSSAATNQLTSYAVHSNTVKANKPPIINEHASTLRRRSSSLSIHDKSKQSSRPRSLVKQSSGDSCSTTNTTQYVPLKEVSNVGDKLSAMTTFKQRRNSFSVATSANKVSANAAAAAAATQARALLGARSKVINSTNTIKASIPVKRVAPMIKLSTDAAQLKTTIPLNSTIQDTTINNTVNKLFCTSTPMPQMRTQQRRSLKPVSSYANSSISTPSLRATSYFKKSAH